MRRRKYEPEVDLDASLEAGVALLEKVGVAYAIAGRLAVWEYVEPGHRQLTKDVDVAVAYGYAEDVAREAERQGFKTKELRIGGYALLKPGIAIDVIDRRVGYAELFQEAVSTARESVAPGELPVVDLEYLIAMKLIPGTPKDDADVEALLSVLADDAYDEARAIVARHLGEASASRMDNMARAVGHPGPGRREARYRQDR
jgi:hypothetical protein